MASEFVERALDSKRPGNLGDFELPRREGYHASPADWRDEVLYFLLPDRFSDGRETERPLLDRGDLAAARPAGWRWDLWAESGARRWQGGTLRGARSKLGYLARLGVTTVWVGPVFKQRGHVDSYHGYGIQDFLEVDPRLGTRRDLVELVAEAHSRGLRVVLDIVFNHSGANWLYPPETPGGPFAPRYTAGRYPFGSWRDATGAASPAVADEEAGVWPTDLQDADFYTRAGNGSLGAGDVEDPHAEHKRSDFFALRDFALSGPGVLSALARCYKYWIALTDCDGFRIDTLKHVSLEEARNFCGTVKEFAANLGKKSFLLLGEVAGGDAGQDRYLDVLDRNLDAALDIGEMRPTLSRVAKGLDPARAYFDGFDAGSARMGSHRNLGSRHVSILDDHDHVFGEKVRFSTEADSDHQVAAATAIQLLTLGIPCIYYGTEQSFAGPERAEQQWLPGFKTGEHADRYLREAMFGPEHPRKSGRDGIGDPPASLDPDLPGFGPFGTAGRHCFDEGSAAYGRIAALTDVRGRFPVLRYGRQYLRPVSRSAGPFGDPEPGELVTWSRILDDEEALCVFNSHGTDLRSADAVVDATLNGPGSALTLVASTSPAHSAGTVLPVKRHSSGAAYVEIREVSPSEVLVFTNRPSPA